MSEIRSIGIDYSKPPYCWGELILDAIEKDDPNLLRSFASAEDVYCGVKQITAEYRRKARAWAWKWLTDPLNDNQRSAGTHLWRVMCWLEGICAQ